MSEIPLRGDRAARDSINYPSLHASDLENGTPIQHMPASPAQGEIPIWNETEGKWETLLETRICVFRTNDLMGVYTPDDDGFASAIADAAPGDKLYLPICILDEDHTIDKNLWIFGTNDEFSIIRGTLTLQANVIIYHCLISKYYSTELCTTIKMDTGCSSLALYNCQIYTNNVSGSIAIEMAADSQALYIYRSMIYSLGDGHGIEVTATNPETCFAEVSFTTLNCVYAYNPDLFVNFITTNCWFAAGINTVGVPGSVREGHQILDDSTPKTQRSNLNLIGFTLTDHADTDTLDVEVTGGGGGGDAADITYTPDDDTDWIDNTDPGNVDGALDQLADRVETLEGAGPPDASDITYDVSVAADWTDDTDPGNTDDALDQLAARVTDIEESAPHSPDASGVTYTPDVATDWIDDTDPGNVDGALDQLAERVTDIESVAVPNGQALFYISGDLTTGEKDFIIPNVTGRSLTISKVYLIAKTGPTGADVIVDVHKDGTTIFTTQSNRPVITAGNTTGQSTTIEVATWADASYLTVHVDQIGSTLPGSNMTVVIVYA